MSSRSPYRVLFLCWGNICRSPAAECVFKHHLRSRGVDGAITCDSAGTIRDHEGNPPDERMRRTGARRGITIDGAARKIRPADLADFDLVLAMDDFNLAYLEKMARKHPPRAEIALFCEYTGLDEREVPDPYYGGQDGFDLVLDLLETGCANLITRIQSETPDAG